MACISVADATEIRPSSTRKSVRDSTCAVGQITDSSSRVPCPITRGVSRSSRTLGAGCDGRGGVARRAAPTRTAKSRGLDASTLASSWRSNPPAMVARKARSPERARRKPLKPIAQGKPDCFGEPVVTTLVSFTLSDARLRVRTSIRLFLRPLSMRDAILPAKLGQNMPRECGATSRRLFDN